MKKLKYIMYCRKSSDSEDRQIQSNEDQEKELNRLAKERNVRVKIILSESMSAKKPGRPVFNKMIKILQEGKADGILCWKVNRLARNPIDGGQIQWLLQQGIIKSILTPGREYLPSDNVMMMSVELGMANQFILDLSKDVKRGMKSKAEKGWRPHTAPIGYINDKFGEKGEKKIFADNERFPIIRKMWDAMLTGEYTVPQVVRKANKEWGLRTLPRKGRGGGELSLATGYKIFTNPFYYGEFKYAGEIYQGKHESMITVEEYNRVQKKLGKCGKPRPKDKRLPFNGVITCGDCGGMITSYEKIKFIKSTGETKSYIYHCCTRRKKGIRCRQKPIKHEDLKEQIEKYLDSITIPKKFLHWALEVLNDNNKIEQNDRNIVLNNLQENYQNCVKSIDNLIQLYISSDNVNRELLSKAEYKSQKNALMSEKTRIESELRQTEKRVSEWVELTEKTFNFATYARCWFEKGDFETKTSILRALGRNFVFLDKKLGISLQKPYLIIKEGLEKIRLETAGLEPVYFIQNQQKTALNQDCFSQWSSQWQKFKNILMDGNLLIMAVNKIKEIKRVQLMYSKG